MSKCTVESTSKFMTHLNSVHGPLPYSTVVYFEDASYDPVTDQIYWIEAVTKSFRSGCKFTTNIGRFDFNGSNPELVVRGINPDVECYDSSGIENAYPVLTIDVNSRRLYWVTQTTRGTLELQRATLNGKNIETLMEKSARGPTDIVIDKNSGDIYWVAAGDIFRISPNGTIETVIDGEGVSSVDIDSLGNLFWTNSGPPVVVSTATSRGNNINILYQSPQDNDEFWNELFIDVYRDFVYFTQAQQVQGYGRKVYRMKKDGSELPTIVQPFPDDAGRAIYIYENDTWVTDTNALDMFNEIVIGLGAFIVVLILVAVLVILKKRRMKPIINDYIDIGQDFLPTNVFTEKELDRSKLQLYGKIGNGDVCDVFKGRLTTGNQIETVAIKMLKAETDSPELNADFLKEIKLNIEIGFHPNVVTLLGCVTIDKPIYLVTEYMKYGDLLNFLRKCNKEELIEQDSIYKLDKVHQLAISHQIAKGMEYLSTTHYYHGDLAARNILVGGNLMVKISDFGMADDIYTDGYKRIAPDKKRPVKWVSLETNMTGECTMLSDVWSFGLVLYEIFTFGGIPYQRMQNEEVVTRLVEGYRMPKPENCPEEIYEIMRNCWLETPADRPPFTSLVSTIDNLISQHIYYDSRIIQHTYMDVNFNAPPRHEHDEGDEIAIAEPNQVTMPSYERILSGEPDEHGLWAHLVGRTSGADSEPISPIDFIPDIRDMA